MRENIYLDINTDITAVQNYLSSSIEDAFNTQDALAVWQAVNGVSNLLNVVECANSPTCSDINRHSCSRVPHTCGECLSGYVGIEGHSNQPCKLAGSAKVVGSPCEEDDDCFSNLCSSTDSGIKYCQAVTKVCPNSCGTDTHGASTGDCVLYQGAAIGRTIPYYPPEDNTTEDTGGGYIGPGNGIDDDYVFIDPNTSAPTSSPTVAPEPFLYTHVANCTANDITCSAVCECKDGHYGMACHVKNDTISHVLEMREQMCHALVESMAIQDTSVEVAFARVVTVRDLLFDLTQTTDSALANCTSVLIQTISSYPEVASDDRVMSYMVDTLSLVFRRG